MYSLGISKNFREWRKITLAPKWPKNLAHKPSPNFFLPETGFYTTEMPPIQVSANQGTVSSSRQDTSTKSL